MSKPSLPQGTRDFGPETVRKRNHILHTIKTVFELFGFQPLETPAMENLETLMGKYGDEGDKLIFKILNNGLHDPKNLEKARKGFETVLTGRNDRNLTERALRYDLTIPFARYVAMNHGQLNFPFKRYQVQPVWRADRPQKGRYREFYQCDADVVGSTSLFNEVELVHIYHEVFSRLGIGGYELRINSRKVLASLAETCGGADQLTAITVAIDKLDKVGIDKVVEELFLKGLSKAQVDVIEAYLSIEGDNTTRMARVATLLEGTEQGKQGLDELRFILSKLSPTLPVLVDFTLARGLNYYTGTIFEAKAPPQIAIGSIGGGGRYDDLTGLFGVKDVPGVGISFGVDRIYDVMEEMGVFPKNIQVSTQVLFLNHGDREAEEAFLLVQQLRAAGVSSELYHEPQKIDRQYKYAEKKNIPFVVASITGDQLVLKDIRSGKNHSLSIDQLMEFAFV